MKQLTRERGTEAYANILTAELDFEPILRHPLIVAMHQLAHELFGLNFVIHRTGGLDAHGQRVSTCVYGLPGSNSINPFCSSLLQHPASQAECTRAHTELLTTLFQKRAYHSIPCRFDSGITCTNAIPIEPRPNLVPGVAAILGCRHPGAPVVAFDAIRDRLRAENPEYDLQELETLYAGTPRVSPDTVADYFPLLKEALDRVTAEHLDQMASPSAATSKKSNFHFLKDSYFPSLRELVRDSSDLPVVLEGEAGTGKEILARTIHDSSSRRNAPFIVVPCATLSLDLIEAELFGYEKGAFSGAHREFAGYFERAHGGTLYFDEISEFPLDVQSRLLRVIETGEFRRLGSTVNLAVNTRIYTGTRRNPRRLMEQGVLLPALYYRIHGIRITILALRDTPHAIPIYADSFLEEPRRTGGRPLRFSTNAMRALCAYAWPGNLRQLRNVVIHAAAMARTVIGPRHLPEEIRDARPVSAAPAGSLKSALAAAVDAATRRHYTAALEHAHGEQETTARLLGVSRATLYRKFKQWGIQS